MIIFEFDRCSGGLAPRSVEERGHSGYRSEKSRDIQGAAKRKSGDIQGKPQLRKTKDTE